MSRELDAKVAEKVFGYIIDDLPGPMRMNAPNPLRGDDEEYDWRGVPHYSEDVRDDYEVLNYVRDKWLIPDQYKFLADLQRIIEWRKKKVAGRLHSSFFLWYEPGDYSKAALKALGEAIDDGAKET